MKKSLIAIAIAAAVPTIASAQQVTIFGVMDAGYNSVNVKSTPELTRNQTGGNAAGALASNRLGFRGTEKIGDLTAGFHYELGMDAGGTGDLSTTGGVRKSTVSLSGGFGAIEIGRDYNPIFLLAAAGDTSRADNVNIGKTVYGQVATTRNSGLMTYTTPTMGGLVGKIAYASRTTDPSSQTVAGDTESTGGSLVYSAGPLMVGVAVNSQKNWTAAAAASVVVTAGAPAVRAATAASNITRDETLLAATYMVNKELSLQAMYGEVKSSVANTDYKATQIGARYMLSPSMTILGSFGKGDGLTAGTAATGVYSAGNGDLNGYKLGFINSFSARTRAYALYGAGDLTTKAGAKTERSEIAIGLNHSF